jgi:hypothetical protein
MRNCCRRGGCGFPAAIIENGAYRQRIGWDDRHAGRPRGEADLHGRRSSSGTVVSARRWWDTQPVLDTSGE